MDSDFDIDENDEPVSDQETEEGKRKKKTTGTKAYKVNELITRVTGSSLLPRSTSKWMGETYNPLLVWCTVYNPALRIKPSLETFQTYK